MGENKNKIEAKNKKESIGILRKSVVNRGIPVILTISFFIFFISLCITFLMWNSAELQQKKELQNYFDYRVREEISMIVDRLKIYEQVLQSTKALFSTSDNISRKQYSNYVSNLQIGENYPGIQGVGFSKVIPKAGVKEHITSIRKEGFPQYTIRPEGERDFYTSIVYLEPFSDRNLRAFGFDMYSEATRRKAMEESRDDGITIISGKVTLIQETEKNAQAGFLMYTPIYKNNFPHRSYEERRTNLLGWAYAPFRMNDFMNGLNNEKSNDFQIMIYDGKEITEKNLMFFSKRHEPKKNEKFFEATKQVEIYGRIWSIHIHAHPLFETKSNQNFPLLILISGIVGSFIISYLAWILLYSRKKVEEALEESETRFKMLFENMSDAFSLHEIIVNEKKEPVDFKYLMVNSAYERHFNQKSSDVIGKTIREINPNVDHNMIKKYGEVALTGTPFKMEYFSKLFNKHISVSTFSPKKGQFASISEDISERKNMENKIKEMSEENRRIFEYAINMSCIAGFDGYFKLLNSSWEKILGWSNEELMAKPFIEFVHPEDREATLKAAEELSEAKNIFSFENRYICKNGEYKWLLWNSTFDLQRKVIYASVLNVTERKQSEEKVKQINSRLALATQAGGVGIWEFDVINNSLLWDEHMFRLYGVDEKEFSFAYDAWIRGVHPEDRERGDREIQMALSGEKEFNTEFRVCWQNGSVHNIRGMAVVQRDETGKPLRMIGTNWDITAQKEQERQFLVAKEQAEKANMAKSEFLANMSHEIRTPMNAIIGFTELLENEIKEGKSYRYLSGIKTAGKNLLNLINDILDLSKIEAGKVEINYEETDIKALFEEILQIFHFKAEQKSIELQANHTNTVPDIIFIDELRIRQILLNLVGNAVKFTDKGFVKIYSELININKKENEVDFCIKVVDSGIGIDSGAQEMIFDAFTQQSGQNTRKYGGTGLGLAISKRLANMMNGEIKLESTAGEGSTFTLILKNVKYSERTKEEKEVEDARVCNYNFEKAKILIVEDIKSNTEVLEGHLSKYKFELFVAENGAIAVMKAKELKPDLIFMDMQMPIMDGYEATKIIKSDDETKNIKIVALTASVIKEDQKKVKQICDGYLRKPITKNELLKELAKHIKYTEVCEIENTKTYNILNPETKNILKEKMYPGWKKINKLIIGCDVEEFALQLKEIAKEYKEEELLNYSEKLFEYASEFDIQNMEEQFRAFEKYFE